MKPSLTGEVRLTGKDIMTGEVHVTGKDIMLIVHIILRHE